MVGVSSRTVSLLKQAHAFGGRSWFPSNFSLPRKTETLLRVGSHTRTAVVLITPAPIAGIWYHYCCSLFEMLAPLMLQRFQPIGDRTHEKWLCAMFQFPTDHARTELRRYPTQYLSFFLFSVCVPAAAFTYLASPVPRGDRYHAVLNHSPSPT